ncbi:hypothetical protein DKG34_40250 [Streptomyces sp. NWU49]|nr:hypothetical protein DKG34_40250 [Streptomyces sp. NWU49]
MRAALERMQYDPAAGVRAALERMQYDPAAGVRAALERIQYDPAAGVRAALERVQYDPAAGVRAALERMQYDPAAGVRAALERMQYDPLAGVRAALAKMQLDPLAGVLHGIADRAHAAYPLPLLERITRLRKSWLPANLRHLRPDMWPLVFRVSVKEGLCFAWAPRPSIVDELLHLKTSKERRQLLLDRRREVVVDVVDSLQEVTHPDLATYADFAAQAAGCVDREQDAAAQALLGNILDSALRVYGRVWFRDHFGSSGDTNHKLVQTSLARQDGHFIAGGSTKLAPYLLAISLKNAFDGHKRQSTFNRNLTAHHVREDVYRPEFALTTLLVVQGLLRQLDGYLCTEPDLVGREDVDDGAEWSAVLNEALTVFGALNQAVAKKTFVMAVEEADPEEYRAKRAHVMNALNGFRTKLPPAYGAAPKCDTCSAIAVPGPPEARCGKPGTFWWCESCHIRLGDRKPQ